MVYSQILGFALYTYRPYGTKEGVKDVFLYTYRPYGTKERTIQYGVFTKQYSMWNNV